MALSRRPLGINSRVTKSLACLGLHSKTYSLKKKKEQRQKVAGLLIFGPSLTGSQQYVGGIWSIGQARSFVLCSAPYAMGGQAHVSSEPCLFFSLKCQHPPTPRLHAFCRQQLSRTVQSLRASGQMPPHLGILSRSSLPSPGC